MAIKLKNITTGVIWVEGKGRDPGKVFEVEKKSQETENLIYHKYLKEIIECVKKEKKNKKNNILKKLNKISI